MNDGILLELLAELFQSLAAGGSLTVSRRHVFRRSAQDVAEVDLLVSGRFGSSRMSVAVECRDRAQPQGKEWIQQLVGKRDDLRAFGVRHWIAVSSTGFTTPASELAQREGIELLVPCSVEPQTLEASGPHTLMSFQLSRNKWKFGDIQAEISHNGESALKAIQDALATDAVRRVVIEQQQARCSLLEHLVAVAEQEFDKHEVAPRVGSEYSLSLHMANLTATLDNTTFSIPKLHVDAWPIPEVIKSEFRLLTFSHPQLLDFIGMIGVNEFELDGELVYLLVGYKPGFPAKFVYHGRTRKGAPIPGWIIQLDQKSVEEAGFCFPEKGKASALLSALLKSRT
jgi:hypothetical protein